jgi:hypothetical protein
VRQKRSKFSEVYFKNLDCFLSEAAAQGRDYLPALAARFFVA